MPTLWQQIARTATEHKARRITDLFAADTKRFDHFSRQIPGMLADFSKTNIDNETLDNLIALAGERGVSRHIAAMFAGEPINVTEDRPVLHTTCRAGADAPAETRETLARMRALSEKIRSGSFTGFSGKAIRNIVVIGIGGSVLGLQAASIALRAFQATHLKLHIVSNVEGSDLAHVIDHIDLEETLFFIASKSFSTPETMLNAELARARLLAHYHHEGTSVARHFVALSSHGERVKAFGIAPENMFAFRDWVGGRFSSWSAIGLPLMVMIGPDHFEQWLASGIAISATIRLWPWCLITVRLAACLRGCSRLTWKATASAWTLTASPLPRPPARLFWANLVQTHSTVFSSGCISQPMSCRLILSPSRRPVRATR